MTMTLVSVVSITEYNAYNLNSKQHFNDIKTDVFNDKMKLKKFL